MSPARGLLFAASLALGGATGALATDTAETTESAESMAATQETSAAQPAKAHTDTATPDPATTCDSCAARKQNLRKLYEAQKDD
ncbi:MAG: hypothetical protein RIG84_17590 [Roseovarius sp.]